MDTDMDIFAAAASGAAIGITFSMMIYCSIMLILRIIAYFKIFSKANEEGWKAIIPFYNQAIILKITNLSPWLVLINVAIALIIGYTADNDAGTLLEMITFCLGIASVVIYILRNINLAKSFKKTGWFAAGLVVFPTIFSLILAFDSSEYVGEKYTGETIEKTNAKKTENTAKQDQEQK